MKALWIVVLTCIITLIPSQCDNDSFSSFMEKLERSFSRLARDEMGVMALQAAFDSMKYQPIVDSSVERDLQTVTSLLSRRLRDYTHIVSSTKSVALRLLRTHKTSPITPRFDCCNLSELDLRPDLMYGCRVSRRKSCDLIPRGLSSSSFNPGHNLTRRFQQQLDYWPNVKWFYFITREGLHTEFPAHNFQCAASQSNDPTMGLDLDHVSHISPTSYEQMNPHVHHCYTLHQIRHRDIFVRSMVHDPIWMIIILDQGEASQMQLFLAQRIARILLFSLSEKDHVTVLLASDRVQLLQTRQFMSENSSSTTGPCSDSLDKGQLFTATEGAKKMLDKFIHSSTRPLPVKTNHSLALIRAFEILRSVYTKFQSNGQDPNRMMRNAIITYISRGNLADLNEASDTLREVAHQQSLLNDLVYINTYMPMEEKSSTVLFERTFMNDLATRWSSFSQQNPGRSVKMGQFFPINRTSDLSESVGRFFEVFNQTLESNVSKSTTMDSDLDSMIELEPDVQTENQNHTADQDMTKSTSGIHYSLPYHDIEGGDLVISISQAFKDDEGQIFGVMGLDIHLLDLLDNVAYFSGKASTNSGAGSTVAFVVHAPSGFVYYHPLLGQTRLVIDRIEHRLEREMYINAFLESQVFSKSGNRRRNSNAETLRFGRSVQPDSSTQTNRTTRKQYASNQDSKDHHDDDEDHETDHLNWFYLDKLSDQTDFKSRLPNNWALHYDSILEADIADLERLPGFRSMVRNRLLTENQGQVGLLVKLTLAEVELFGLSGVTSTCESWNSSSTQIPFRIVYHWKRIIDPPSPMVVVLRSVESLCHQQRQLAPLVPDFEFHYHRLDLINHPQTCMYLRQMATFSFGTIYLAPKAFSRPFLRLTQGYLESLNDVRHLIAYLFDHTVLISDPGLASTIPSIRSSVAVVERIAKFWNHRSHVSELRDFIVRRYVATDNGVMLIYPGTLMSHTYDPTIQTWYRRALSLPGHLVITGPYMDGGGAGKIITLSRTIFEGNQTGLHYSGRDKVAAVIGMDVTYRFLNLMLAHWLPKCGPSLKSEHSIDKQFAQVDNDIIGVRSLNKKPSNRNQPSTKTNSDPSPQSVSNKSSEIKTLLDGKSDSDSTQTTTVDPDLKNQVQTRCLLVEDRGHMIAHPNLYVPGLNRPIEHNHLSFYEPGLATDLVNHQNLVTKSSCLNYEKRVVQRQYSLNLSTKPNEILQNTIPSDQCIKYQFARIPHSNLFFGLVHEDRRLDCMTKPIFCPCSTRSRRCLNCEQQIEQRECECPCECPLAAKVRTLPDLDRQADEDRSHMRPQRGWTLRNWVNLDDNATSVKYLSDQEAIPVAQYPPCSNVMDSEHNAIRTPNLDFRLSLRSISPVCRLDTDRYGSLTASPTTSASFPPDQNKSDFDLSSDNTVRCARRGRVSCSAAVGCEWCSLASNLQELEHPFCSSMSICPNGIMNSFSTPFGASQFGGLEAWSVRNPIASAALSQVLREADSSFKEPLHRLIELMARKARQFQQSGRFESDEDDNMQHLKQPSQQQPQQQDRSSTTVNIPLGPIASAILGSLTIFTLVIYFIHHQKRLRRENMAASRLSQQLQQQQQQQQNNDTFSGDPTNPDPNSNHGICANEKCNNHFGNSDGCPPPAPGAGTMGISTTEAPALTYELSVPSDTDTTSHDDGLDSELKNPLLPKPCTIVELKAFQLPVPTTSGQLGFVADQPTYSKAEQNIESGIEDEAPSEPNELLVQCGSQLVSLPPNPYHMGISDLPSPRSGLAFTCHGTSARNRELDSAVGSDCATAASISSSSASKLGLTDDRGHHHHNDELQSSSECLAERPLGICIGTLIMGPDKPNLPDKTSFC